MELTPEQLLVLIVALARYLQHKGILPLERG